MPFFGQRLSKLVQSGSDSRLYRSERLVQPCCHFGIRQFREECRLDRLSLVFRQDGQGGAEVRLEFRT